MSGKQDQSLKSVERERQAVQLRLAGCSYSTIATKLGFASRSGAYKAISRALKRTLQEPSDELRALVGGRLDELLLATWPAARSGHLGAVDRCLKIIERQCRLHGLDAPIQTDLSLRAGGAPVTFTLDIGNAQVRDDDPYEFNRLDRAGEQLAADAAADAIKHDDDPFTNNGTTHYQALKNLPWRLG